MSRDLRAAAWVAAVVTLFLAVFHRSELIGSDEVGVYEQTVGLAQRGDLSMPPITHAYAGRDGRLYSHFAIGQSVLAVPFYALGSLVERGPRKLAVILSGPGMALDGRSYRSPHVFTVLLLPLLLTGLLGAVFHLFQRLIGVSPGWAAVASIATTLTTYVAYMSAFFLRHSAETLWIFSAFYCFARFARGARPVWLLLGSSLASAVFLTRLPAAIAALPIAAYLAWVLVRRFGGEGGAAWRHPEAWRALAVLAAPVALALVAHVSVNYLRWGSLLESPMMAHRARFSTPLSVSGVANLVGPGSSVFLFSPLLVLVPLLAVAGWRRERSLVVLGLGTFAVFWVFFSRYDFWTGLWSAPGPRYLTAPIPLLLLPLGLWLEGSGRAGRALFFAVAGVGLVIQVALLTTSWRGIVVLGGYQEMGTPDFPFAFLSVPEKSPVLVALRLFLEGRANGTWLAQLAAGWPGFEGAPAAAAGLGAAWILGLVLCGLRLRASLDPATIPGA